MTQRRAPDSTPPFASALSDSEWMAARQTISLEIGPFLSHGDLLRFAADLEAHTDIGEIELVHAGPRMGRFLVEAESGETLAAAIADLSAIRASAVVAGSSVKVHVHDSSPRAVQVFAPMTVAPRRRRLGLVPWGRAALVAALLLFLPLGVWLGIEYRDGNLGLFSQPSQPVQVSPPPASVSGSAGATTRPPSIVVTPPAAEGTTGASGGIAGSPATPVPTSEATPTATAEPAPEATPEPTAVATPEPTPVATVAPAPVQQVAAPASDSHSASISTGFGILTALNGCSWNTAVQSDIVLSLAPGANGSLNGDARTTGELRYFVASTPSDTVCEPGLVTLEAAGAARTTGDQLKVLMTGERGLRVAFDGVWQGNEAVGTVAIERLVGTKSNFGETSELRSSSISGVRIRLSQ